MFLIPIYQVKPKYPIIPTKLKICTHNNTNSKKLTVSPTIYSDYNTFIQSPLRNYHVKFVVVFGYLPLMIAHILYIETHNLAVWTDYVIAMWYLFFRQAKNLGNKKAV